MTSKKGKKRSDSKRPVPPPAAPAPDIQVGFTTPGRETLAAIAEELGPDGIASAGRGPADEAPDIEIGQGTAGRETLAAIDEELYGIAREHARRTVDYEDRPPVAEPPPRPRQRTLGFEEAAPGSRTAPYRTRQKAPARPGRATLDAIEQELSTWAESGTPPRVPVASNRDLEVFEMATFVVKGDLAHLASPGARQQFVEQRLLRRLPVQGMADVARIDVTPWTVHGTVVVRVWCRVPLA